MTTEQYIDGIRMRIIFSESLSDIPVHNHLNGAYHKADMYAFAPPWSLMWKIPSITVPREVQQVLRPDELVAELIARIARAREVIDQLRPDLDREIESIISFSPDPTRPDPNLHPFVNATHRHTPGYATSWGFRFNPYRLAVALLDEYEGFIIKTMRGKESAFTKLSRIHRKTKKLEVNARLVENEIR